MIRVRGAPHCRDEGDGNQERSLIFHRSDSSNSPTNEFGVLAVYSEIVLPPGAETR